MEHKDYEYPDLKVGEDFSTENEQGEVENWKCVGQDEDGCPICEKTMDFGGAISALKAGKKVARLGWNGKGMFLWLKPATEVKSEWCKDPMLKGLADENGGSISALGTICMYTRDSTGRRAILTGWLASQSDMLLEDWVTVE